MDKSIPKVHKQDCPFFARDMIFFLLSTPALFIVVKNLEKGARFILTQSIEMEN
jgi:hypothetical protein